MNKHFKRLIRMFTYYDKPHKKKSGNYQEEINKILDDFSKGI